MILGRGGLGEPHVQVVPVGHRQVLGLDALHLREERDSTVACRGPAAEQDETESRTKCLALTDDVARRQT